MEVVERKPIPVYAVTCPECGSVIQYMAAEVSFSHINCPVCHVSIWANTISPVRYSESTP